MSTNFQRYMKKFRVEKGHGFTHTGMGDSSGSYYVPSESMNDLFIAYANALEAGESVCLTEKHKATGPVVVDIDFRYETQRKHTHKHLHTLAQIYARHLASLVHFDAHFHVYMFEKVAPAISGRVQKDGIHIIIPNVSTRPSVQKLLRDRILVDPEMIELYKEIGSSNPLTDAIDEAVISKNNWMMYGSRKPGSQHAYQVTKCYTFDIHGAYQESLAYAHDTLEAVQLFSIRNKTDVVRVKNEIMPEITQIEALLVQKMNRNVENIIGTSVNSTNSIIPEDEFEVVKRLVSILKPERADGYEDWMRVGWCLRNIDSRLLPSWIEFSQRSSKFVEGECDKKWNYMRNGGLGIGTLHMWAKHDNADEYNTIIRKDLHDLIMRSMSMAHYDIARVVYHMFRYQFVCAGIRNRCWYEFRDHRWHSCDCGYSLRAKISTSVWREYAAASAALQTRAVNSTEEQEQQRFQEQSKKMLELSIKLKNTSFKENIMKECAELLYSEKFEEKLDSNPHMLCFENGVYDMNSNEFREGRPEDYISFSTGCNYIPFEPGHSIIAEIDRFFRQVQPKECKRIYLLSLFASFLCGHIKDQKFHIWTGSGSNGKSVAVELFEKAIGAYCCKFPITLLTQKRAASNAATGELARAKGRRLAVLQEPSEDEKLQVGLMKELTGGDTIMCRALYKDPIEYKPQYKLILLCNHLPSVPSDDGGTWRRIRVIEWTSKFVDNPKEANEFPIDLELSNKFDSWKEHFMSMLLNKYYPMIQHASIKEPEDVMICTREYQHNNDHMSHFIDICIEKSDTGFLTIDESFLDLKNWVRDDNVPFKVPKKNEFQKALEKRMGGRPVTIGGCIGFKGYRVRNRYAKPSVEDEKDDIDF